MAQSDGEGGDRFGAADGLAGWERDRAQAAEAVRRRALDPASRGVPAPPGTVLDTEPGSPGMRKLARALGVYRICRPRCRRARQCPAIDPALCVRRWFDVHPPGLRQAVMGMIAEAVRQGDAREARRAGRRTRSGQGGC